MPGVGGVRLGDWSQLWVIVVWWVLEWLVPVRELVSWEMVS